MPSIKVIHADEIRRIAIPDSYADAVKVLEANFGTGISLLWKDEDGDLISIKTDADMQEAFQTATTSAPRIILNRTGATTAEPEPEPKPEPAVPALTAQPEPEPEVAVCYLAPPEPGGNPVHVQPEPDPELEPTQAAVHCGVQCDRSGMNPIIGTRWHMVGHNYDLCDAEFQKLPEEAKLSFEEIRTPGSAPVGVEPAAKENEKEKEQAQARPHGPERILEFILPGVDTTMIKGVFENVASEVQRHCAQAKVSAAAYEQKRRGKMAVANKACKAKAHHAARMCGGWQQQAVRIGAGELPEAPIPFGSFGPGVAQLQIALIKTGAMDESAIMWKQGVYGPHTAQAVATLQERYQLDGQRGTMDEQVAKILAEKLAGTFIEPAAAPTAAPTPSEEPAPTPAPTSAEGAEEGSAAEETARCPIVELVANHGEDMADEFVQVEEAHLFEEEQGQEQVEEPEPTPEPTTEPVTKERWGEKLEQLAQMGFLNKPVLTPLLDRHNGSIISVVAELLDQ